MGSPTKDIINDLMESCIVITADATRENKKYLQEPLDTSQTIDVFFKVIDDRLILDKHTVLSSTSTTNGLSRRVIFCNLHICI